MKSCNWDQACIPDTILAQVMETKLWLYIMKKSYKIAIEYILLHDWMCNRIWM